MFRSVLGGHSHPDHCHLSVHRIATLLTTTVLPILLLLCKESSSVRIIKFEVPSAKSNGSSAVLHCDYDLEQNELYSVKFYKDYFEFYRYLPKDSPPAQAFKLDGIHLDESRSNATHVMLHRTDLNSDGLYSCEISTEGPAFATRKNEKLMKIYVLPKETLSIQGGLDYYKVNDQVSFVCTSGAAWPVMQLTWYINDVPAAPEYLTHFKPTIEREGLARAKLGLSFRATKESFSSGHLRLRCGASLTLVYELKATEFLIDGSKKQRTSPRRYSNNDLAHLNSKDLPLITGVRDKYNVNETVSLNCTTTSPKANLRWLINGYSVNSTHLIHYPRHAKSSSTLGLRFQMEKKFFQTEEIELRCVASFAKVIADFQESVIIKTYNSEFYYSENSAPWLHLSAGCWVSSLLLTLVGSLFLSL